MWTETEVEKIVIENKVVNGLIGKRYITDGQSTELLHEFRISANIEVILSAGALSSPKLLMLRCVAFERPFQEHDILTVLITVASVRKMNFLSMAYLWCLVCPLEKTSLIILALRRNGPSRNQTPASASAP